MKDPYHSIARRYDQLEIFVDQCRKMITDAVKGRFCRKVLDLCCGTGTQVCMLLKGGVTTVGLDASLAMLAQAQRKTRAHSCYVLGDACRLPFGNGTFDGVILSFALHEKKEDERWWILNEVHRVLQPEGWIFALDYSIRQTMGTRILRIVAAWLERAAGSDHYMAFRDYLSRGGLPRLLEHTNFSLDSSMDLLGGLVSLVIARRKETCFPQRGLHR